MAVNSNLWGDGSRHGCQWKHGLPRPLGVPIDWIPWIGLAFFPGRSHLRSLITCSMQIWMEKALKNWSCVMTSGRQTADTQEVVSDKGFQSPFLWCLSQSCWRPRAFARQHQYMLLFATPGDLLMEWHETGILTVRHHSVRQASSSGSFLLEKEPGYKGYCVYHLSTWCPRTWPYLSGFPPPYFLQVNNYWRWELNGLGMRLWFGNNHVVCSLLGT